MGDNQRSGGDTAVVGRSGTYPDHPKLLTGGPSHAHGSLRSVGARRGVESPFNDLLSFSTRPSLFTSIPSMYASITSYQMSPS